MYRVYLLLLVIFATLKTIAQDTTLLICGPMLGYVEHREALIWIEVSSKVNKIQIKYFKKSDPENVHSFIRTVDSNYDYNPEKLVLSGLDMNSEYEYQVFLNGQQQRFSFPLTFKTKMIWEYRMPPPAFSFLFGSCAYINDAPYDRPGEPYGRDPRIFDSMAVQPSDFMLWLGDNMYTREADWTSQYGFYYRYTHDRKIPEMKKLLASRPNFAIWDDHDYGSNDAGSSFELKNISLEAFKDFWGNPSYGEWNNPGVYTKFTESDCDFFLLDGRFYRDEEEINDSAADKHYLGSTQLKWLENALLNSKASFKFICTGSQVLNPMNDFETILHYQKEYDELMSFIKHYKIPGIIFLTGDRHFSEIIKVQSEDMYPQYDITSSALTSRPYSKFGQTKEANNPNRVVPFAVLDQNYIKIEVSGEKLGERIASISCFTVENKIVWQHQINQTDLKFE